MVYFRFGRIRLPDIYESALIPQFAELQYGNDGQKKHYNVNFKCAADAYLKFLLWVYLLVRIILCKLILFLSELNLYWAKTRN